MRQAPIREVPLDKLVKLNALLVKTQYVLLAGLFILMLLLMLTQVLFRYFLEMPLAWSEEVARYIFIVVTYLGAAIAIAEKNHIEINVTGLIYNKLRLGGEQKKKADQILEMTTSLIILSLTGAFTYYCLIYAKEDYTFEQTSTALGIPLYLVSGCIALSMAIMAFHSLIQLLVHSKSILSSCGNDLKQKVKHDAA